MRIGGIMLLPDLGTLKDEIDTPALCVDLDQLEANIRYMAGTCRERAVAWRPHSKCHKSPQIAQKLIAAGAIGVTCAKLGEAEVMASGGVTDLLIANMLAGPHKVRRLVALTKIADPIVCIDHVDQATAMAAGLEEAGQTVRAIVDVDLGMKRTGVPAGRPALELARSLDQLPGMQLCGIMGYEGHLLQVADPKDKAEQIAAALDQLGETRDLLIEDGLNCDIVSCGGTGSFTYATQHPAVTEVQAGGGIFMDDFYRDNCQVTEMQPALTLVATIVSRPAVERAIMDAGRKSLNQELAKPRVISHAGIELSSLSAEHGALKLLQEANGDQQLRIGDRVELMPGYSDWTCVLHDHLLGFRDGRLEVVWPLEARGRLQ